MMHTPEKRFLPGTPECSKVGGEQGGEMMVREKGDREREEKNTTYIPF